MSAVRATRYGMLPTTTAGARVKGGKMHVALKPVIGGTTHRTAGLRYVACTGHAFKTGLVAAASVPEENRCQHSGCKPWWPA